MSTPLLSDAFAHHVWATVQLIDSCLALSPEQLRTAVPGTYGSIIKTMRHLVGGDASYLFVLTAGRVPEIDEEGMDLAALRGAMEANGVAWSALLAQELDPDATVTRHRDDGIDSHAPMGIRLAQALHHGTDHRSQICTALTTLGIEPPEIDVWAFAALDGRVVEVTR
jgi:uncharacterized damage-inducible protein DinB